ncbi:MAG: phage holin family protein [Bacteroidales bacterium]|nr:phage holin family protein [Bacteroidales bacterium]MDD3664074.1 phage holin family protein [Bacteroidales bacterium]
MRLIIRFIGSAMVVSVLAAVIPGISISGFGSALFLVVVLTILNLLVKPILVLLTIPVTLLTFGLFLLVINAVIILMASGVVVGFRVDGFVPALLFSLANSAISYLLSLADN